MPFESYSKISGLGKLCNLINKDNTKVVAPYNNETVSYFEIDKWISISVKT